MSGSHELDGFDTRPAHLEREWLVRIQSPLPGVAAVVEALQRDIPLCQGAYAKCLYVTGAGTQQFEALAGSHAGAEGTLQTTPATEITFSIPPDKALLDRVFETVFAVHVNEEPTIHVQELWGCRSKYLDDKDNPNRYWNRADAAAIHGQASS